MPSKPSINPSVLDALPRRDSRISTQRLHQIRIYADALAIRAAYADGNITDTRDIVRALDELIARREFRQAS